MTVLTQAWRTGQVFGKIWKYLKLADRPGADFRKLKQQFAEELARHLELQVRRDPLAQIEGPAIYVCNHISYLDIPLVMQMIPEACFVSKSEVASWPVIGLAAQRIETVFVKRESSQSRENVRKALVRALKEEGKKIIVFPSGTTTLGKTERWRKGAFEIARDHGIPVLPLRLTYSPLRPIAYIDKDFFPWHLFQLVKRKDMQVRLECGEPVWVQDPLKDCSRIQAWCEANMLSASVASDLEAASASDPAAAVDPG